jgi:hypothetical protein
MFRMLKEFDIHAKGTGKTEVLIAFLPHFLSTIVG